MILYDNRQILSPSMKKRTAFYIIISGRPFVNLWVYCPFTIIPVREIFNSFLVPVPVLYFFPSSASVSFRYIFISSATHSGSVMVCQLNP